MKITIEFDDDREDEVIDVTLDTHDDGVSRYIIDANDYSGAVQHKVSDGPIALVERAIFKLRRAGLK